MPDPRIINVSISGRRGTVVRVHLSNETCIDLQVKRPLIANCDKEFMTKHVVKLLRSWRM